MSPPSPYEVLGVGQAATSVEVRKAYLEALRAGAHPKPVIRDAFTRLKDTRARLVADLHEPEPPAVLGRLADAVAAGAGRPLIDDGSAPLPSWRSLVVPGLTGPDGLHREVPPPAGGFPAGRELGPPTSALVPAPEFPV